MILFIGVSAFVLGLWLGAHYAAIKIEDWQRERQARRIRQWMEEELGQ